MVRVIFSLVIYNVTQPSPCQYISNEDRAYIASLVGGWFSNTYKSLIRKQHLSTHCSGARGYDDNIHLMNVSRVYVFALEWWLQYSHLNSTCSSDSIWWPKRTVRSTWNRIFWWNDISLKSDETDVTFVKTQTSQRMHLEGWVPAFLSWPCKKIEESTFRFLTQ